MTPQACSTGALPNADCGLRIAEWKTRTINKSWNRSFWNRPRLCLPSRPGRFALDRSAMGRSARRGQERMALGNYARVCELTQCPTIPRRASSHVRALANLDTMRAEHVCAEAVGRHPFSVNCTTCTRSFWWPWGTMRSYPRRAAAPVLDRTLAIGHFTLGSILERCGDSAGAARAYRNASDLCTERPPTRKRRSRTGFAAQRWRKPRRRACRTRPGRA